MASAVIVGVLLAGTLWLMSDLWNAHERSELLHIPFRALRAILGVALFVVLVTFVRNAVARTVR